MSDSSVIEGAVGEQPPVALDETPPSEVERQAEGREVRARTLTGKGQQHNLELRQKELKANIRRWRRNANELHTLVYMSEDVHELNQKRDNLLHLFDEVEEAYECVCELAPETETINEFDIETRQLNRAVNDRIKELLELKRETQSQASSSKSKASSRHSVSSKRSEAAIDAAELDIKLKYREKEKFLEEQVEKRKAEAEKLKAEAKDVRLARNREIARAKLAILEEEEDGRRVFNPDILPGQLDVNAKVNSYVQSLNDTPKIQQEASTNLNRPGHNSVNEQLQIPASSALVTPIIVPRTVPSRTRTAEPQSIPNVPYPVNIADQLFLSRLAPVEPGIFTGDPIEYKSWVAAFELLVGHRQISPAEKLQYLKKYVGGPAKECIAGFLLESSDQAYDDARTRLEERYGSAIQIAIEFRQRLSSWSKIGAKDGKALQKLADFLKQCESAMKSNSSLSILNDPLETRTIVQKLPEWTVNRWAREAERRREISGMYPTFAQFANFVSREAKISCDPINSMYAIRSDGSKSPGTADKKQKSATSLATDVKSKPNNDKGNQQTKTWQMRPCHYCKAEHHIDTCPTFLERSVKENKKYATEHQLCFACLGRNHMARVCKYPKQCKVCNKRHPTTLHENRSSKESTDTEPKAQDDSTSTQRVQTLKTVATTKSKTTLIVPVYIAHSSNPGNEVLTYAALDSQSDATFLAEETRQKLGIRGTKVELNMSTMSQSNERVASEKISNLTVRGLKKGKRVPLPPVYVNRQIPMDKSHIPTNITVREWPHLTKLEDEISPLLDIGIGILIGYEATDILCPIDVIPPTKRGEPFAQRTVLGWSVVGGDANQMDNTVMCHRVMTSPVIEGTSFLTIPVKTKEIITPDDVSKLLDFEFSDGDKSSDKRSRDDERFIRVLSSEIRTREDGHLEMPLPFRTDNPKVPNNRLVAEKRFQSLEKKIRRNSKFKEEYFKFMKEIIDKGFAERCQEETPACVWYLPHHGVYHPTKRKLRVVFDASAKYKDTSLNELLLQGPELTNALIGVLCRFRKDVVAISCDIEQMFYQFHVAPRHRDYLRFLWYDDDLTKPPVEYRMTVHLFGASSSPGCANYGLKYVAEQGRVEFGEDAADFVKHNFYVDDGLISVPTVDEAKSLISRTTDLCRKGGIRLHKFVSNREEVLAATPSTDRSKASVNLALNQSTSIERVLGLEWEIQGDFFQFRVQLRERPHTRRGMLSAVSQIYDPLGIIAPITLKGRRILQDACRASEDWDDPLPPNIIGRWKDWCKDLKELCNMRVERCYKPVNFGEVVSTQLHHFCDGSTVGYGQCSYLRLVNTQGEVHCCLVMAKARIAPLKQMTVPRLELSAAALSVKISVYLQEQLGINNVEHHFWSDSEIVLGYICNDAKRFQIFVANRIQQIRDHSSPDQWHHVKGTENPADLASRGANAHELLQKKYWLDGPQFLWSPIVRTEPIEFDIQENDPEVKKVRSMSTQTKEEESFLRHLSKFSSWTRLKRTIGYCLIFVSKLKLRIKKPKDNIDLEQSMTVELLQQAEQLIIKKVQRDAFKLELSELNKRRGRCGSFKGSRLYKLNPFVDDTGILRVGGRLQNSTASFAHKLLSCLKKVISPIYL